MKYNLSEEQKFIAEMSIEYAIKGSRNIISLKDLAAAIHQALPQEEFVSLLKEFQKYDTN